MNYFQQRQAWNQGEKKPEPVREPYRIPRVSKKRQKLNKLYPEVSRPKWKGKRCAIRSPDCTGWAQGWNHADGKENAEKLLDMENGQPACNPCNSYCEKHHAWAVRLGFRGKRNAATKRYNNTYKPNL